MPLKYLYCHVVSITRLGSIGGPQILCHFDRIVIDLIKNLL